MKEAQLGSQTAQPFGKTSRSLELPPAPGQALVVSFAHPGCNFLLTLYPFHKRTLCLLWFHHPFCFAACLWSFGGKVGRFLFSIYSAYLHACLKSCLFFPLALLWCCLWWKVSLDARKKAPGIVGNGAESIGRVIPILMFTQRLKVLWKPRLQTAPVFSLLSAAIYLYTLPGDVDDMGLTE